MYRFSVEELAAKIAALLTVPADRIQQLYLGGPGDIAIVVTDEVSPLRLYKMSLTKG